MSGGGGASSSSRTVGLMDQRDEDWRDTLFYWHGKLSWVGGERNVISWRGTWLSSVSNIMPVSSEFSNSFNFFELNFDIQVEGLRSLQQGRWDIDVFRNVGSRFRGHYLMEPPDGSGYRRAYRDDDHEFLFDAITQDGASCTASMDAEDTQDTHKKEDDDFFDTSVMPTNNSLMDKMLHVARRMQKERQGMGRALSPGPHLLIACKGKNEFGRFVALGQCRRSTRPTASGQGTIDDGLELTVARRYVRDDDSRHAWPLDKFLQSIPISDHRASRLCPWEHALPCRLPADVIAENNRRQEQHAFMQQHHLGPNHPDSYQGGNLHPEDHVNNNQIISNNGTHFFHNAHHTNALQSPFAPHTHQPAAPTTNSQPFATHRDNLQQSHPALCFQPPPPKGPPLDEFSLPSYLSTRNGFVFYENELYRKRMRDD